MSMNTTFIAKVWEALALSVVMFVAGAAFSYWNWAPHQIVEAPAPAVVIAPTATSPHGALMPERKLDTAAKPKQAVPKGFKPERIVNATVTPTAKHTDPAGVTTPCPPVRFDASVVRDADGAGRILISSPDGNVSSATDTVIQSISGGQVRPWAAGISYGSDKTYGGTLERDLGRLRLGADVLERTDGGIVGRVRVLFTFGG